MRRGIGGEGDWGGVNGGREEANRCVAVKTL